MNKFKYITGQQTNQPTPWNTVLLEKLSLSTGQETHPFIEYPRRLGKIGSEWNTSAPSQS
jgi:hypothetical protein